MSRPLELLLIVFLILVAATIVGWISSKQTK